MENLPANCRMRTIRAEALATKDRAKVQRIDTLAKNALFLEYVRRWEPDQAAGEGTNDLKRRLDSLRDENDVLTLECNDYHDQHNEQEAMFAEWELSHDQRRVESWDINQQFQKKLIDDHEKSLKWEKEQRDGLREALTQTQKTLKLQVEENKENLEFALAVKEYQAKDAAYIAILEKSLQRFLGAAGVLKKVAPVAKKQKTEPRKAKGGWGGARKGAAFDAKRASSGIAEQKGTKGQPMSE
jgi:hypothetical protein